MAVLEGRRHVLWYLLPGSRHAGARGCCAVDRGYEPHNGVGHTVRSRAIPVARAQAVRPAEQLDRFLAHVSV